MKTKNYMKLVLAVFSAIALSFHSCKKLIEIDLPIDKTTAEFVFNDPGTATAALTGIYAALTVGNEGGFVDVQGVSLQAALYADELQNHGGFGPEYENNYNGANGYSLALWNNPYRKILYRVNAVIEGISSATGIDGKTKEILLGEAKFIRAFTYFHLVNFFGDVPLVINTDFKINSDIIRSPKTIVYEQIIKDLKEAQAGLTDDYLSNTLNLDPNERVRPNKGAATALLARVYLYTNQWSEAEQEATKIITNTTQYDTVALSEVFLKNSKEAIWQLQPNKNAPDGSGPNTPDAKRFLKNEGDAPECSLTNNLLSAFGTHDNRKNFWVTTVVVPDGSFHVPYKYKLGYGSITQEEYTMVLRLAEQYLIRAEARAEQGQLTGSNSAASDLNVIRQRAGLEATTATTLTEIRDAILNERRVELFTEFGHRWFDLKRTGKIDEVMQEESIVKGTVWSPFKALLPIPYTEFIYNPSLKGHQNPGYLEQE